MRTKMFVGWYSMNDFKNQFPQLLVKKNKKCKYKILPRAPKQFFCLLKVSHDCPYPALVTAPQDQSHFRNTPIDDFSVIQSKYCRPLLSILLQLCSKSSESVFLFQQKGHQCVNAEWIQNERAKQMEHHLRSPSIISVQLL